MFVSQFITFGPVTGSIGIVGASITVDEFDYEGVKIAAKSLAEDLERVTGILQDVKGSLVKNAIILGKPAETKIHSRLCR